MTELVITSGLLLILLMVVAPIFASARASARQSECRSHVSVLCQHLTIYVADYDERFLPPPATGRRDWRPLLEPYFHGRELIAGCPSARPAGAGWATGYAYNDLLVDPGDPRQGMG
ncbi:MAG: hypothetical protein HZB16_24450, partial [Armatimonadetes bacterium]|nr:hypothetical protein [Armatimonadota bacterium]